MALARYELYVFYPGGGLAADADVTVRLAGSNITPPLFTDAAGTVPQTSPVTDADGLLSFYAAPGSYQAEFAGEIFPVPVAESETAEVQPGVFTHTQESPASVWTIAHRFGIQPLVDVIVGNASVSGYETAHPDTETTTVTFQTPTSGVAHLRR